MNRVDRFAAVPAYVYWHYAKAARQILSIAGDFSWFLWHFFSVGLLTRTFLSPWWREREAAPFSFFHLGEYAVALVVNGIILVFGIVVRSVVILVGLAAQVLLWAGALAFFAAWLVLPLILMYLIFAGIVFLFKPI